MFHFGRVKGNPTLDMQCVYKANGIEQVFDFDNVLAQTSTIPFPFFQASDNTLLHLPIIPTFHMFLMLILLHQDLATNQQDFSEKWKFKKMLFEK